MNHCNYTLFEILKYKIEFLDCLEYSMETYDINEKEIEKNINYLKNNFDNGIYKEIISTLFTDYEKVNPALIVFFKTYSPKQIIKIIKNKKAKKKINYIYHLINCHENLNSIITTFTNEKELKNKLDEHLLKLIKTNNYHFLNFLYFITYNMYACTLYPNKTKLKFKKKDINDLITILNYCNKENEFENSIKILQKNDELLINNEFEKISNKCIELEKKQNKETSEIINILNKQLESNKKDNIQL